MTYKLCHAVILYTPLITITLAKFIWFHFAIENVDRLRIDVAIQAVYRGGSFFVGYHRMDVVHVASSSALTSTSQHGWMDRSDCVFYQYCLYIRYVCLLFAFLGM